MTTNLQIKLKSVSFRIVEALINHAFIKSKFDLYNHWLLIRFVIYKWKKEVYIEMQIVWIAKSLYS